MGQFEEAISEILDYCKTIGVWAVTCDEDEAGLIVDMDLLGRCVGILLLRSDDKEAVVKEFKDTIKKSLLELQSKASSLLKVIEKEDE